METPTKQAVQVDGDKLAEAFRRVTPFMSQSEGHPELCAVFAEAGAGTLQLTSSDGYRIAHLTAALPFPDGNYLMAAKGVKDFSDRHYNGAAITVETGEGVITVGEVKVELLKETFLDYPAFLPETFATEAIIGAKEWIKIIRKFDKASVVGIAFDPKGTIAYIQDTNKQTIAHETMPVQTYMGEAQRIAFNAERLRRALTSCGDSCTIQLNPDKPAIFEGEDYWHLLASQKEFPTEVHLLQSEKDMLNLVKTSIDGILSGEFNGRVMSGGGKFYIELNAQFRNSEVVSREPMLKEKTDDK